MIAGAAQAAQGGVQTATGGLDLTFLMALGPDQRRRVIATIPADDMTEILRSARHQLGTSYGLWADDPYGFVTQVLGETVWDKQQQVLESVVRYKQTIVPSAFGVGKTHLAARAVAHMVCCFPVGTTTSVTIATRMRQVERQLWPHIRRLVARAGLPGDCGVTQWKMEDLYGVETVCAYGFTAPAHDEAAMQGIHAVGGLLLVVDEAGGIDPLIGKATRNLLTGNSAHMLAIGNPATDDEATWFEKMSIDGDDPDRPDIHTIRIPAAESPAISGAKVGWCRECPPMIAPHPLSDHLVDQAWVTDAIKDYGPDDPYVIAKVYARFPKGGSSRAIPSSWVDAAVEAPDPDPDDPGTVLLSDLGLDEETRPVPVVRGAWVRLGVDVAADGGDELAICRIVGDVATLEHTSAGSENENAVNVAGVVLKHILRAEALADALGTKAQVRVKVDAIGVGYGIVGILNAWGSEQIHNAEIVSVVVSEKPKREPDSTTMRPLNQRAEMWLAMRSLLQPDQATGYGGLRLGYMDARARAQLSGPKRLTNSGGFAVIERKQDMKSRGVKSPDRAEALLLAAYEPAVKRRSRLVV